MPPEVACHSNPYPSSFGLKSMANDGTLRSAMVWLAAIIVLVGVLTLSLKKMMITYAFGMVGIGGILLPDWDFFDRGFSRWCYPVTVDERAALLSRRSGFKRYRIYPTRVIIYSTIYGIGLYKWWTFISS